MTKLAPIQYLYNIGIFSDLELHFAKLILSLAKNIDENALLAIALASYFTNLGSSCVDLSLLADKYFPQNNDPDIKPILCPNLESWQISLNNCNIVGSSNDYCPIILHGNYLYLYRYFNYEQQLATQIIERCQQLYQDINQTLLETSLNKLFPSNNNQQKVAAMTAISQHFCVISGGPGSGKTSTVTKILAVLLEQNLNLKIALAAPTGKAAMRLQETLINTLPNLNVATKIKQAMPQQAYTIHRLLGSLHHSSYFRYHQHRQLPYDIIIVDEFSMVDLPLITKLVQATPKSARLILLGDKDQLVSIETGTVLNDICRVAISDKLPMAKNIVLLDKSYRFDETSGIGKLSQAVKQGKHEAAFNILNAKHYPEVNWYSLNSSNNLPTDLINYIVTEFSHYLQANSPEQMLSLFNSFCVLCATRKGYHGLEAINHQIEKELNKRKLIKLSNYRWYHKCPIMITSNHYGLELFNGDIGIILRDSNNELKAFFPAANGKPRIFWPNRLPKHEIVYAMTIHKSQGSEFDKVLMLLPKISSSLLTRELIYTGITRARKQVDIWSDKKVLTNAILQQVNRSSGLYEQLQSVT